MITEFDTAVREHYRDAVRELSEASHRDAAELKEARQLTVERVRDGIQSGVVIAPKVDDQIRAQVNKTDDRDKKTTDSVLKRLMWGEDQLPMPVAEMLRITVILGDGKRKPWEFITWHDLETMDEVRYRNVEAQQLAYQEWRPKFIAIRDGLRTYHTVEMLMEHGPLMPMGDE